MGSDLTRRRAPAWVRAYSDRSLHGLGIRLQRDMRHIDISAGQQWLFDAVVSELEYRHRRTRPTARRCSCELCVPPFPCPELEQLR